MKKLIVLSAAVVLTLASCGKKEEVSTETTVETVDSTTVATEEVAPAVEATPATEVEAASAATAE